MSCGFVALKRMEPPAFLLRVDSSNLRIGKDKAEGVLQMNSFVSLVPPRIKYLYCTAISVVHTETLNIHFG